MITDEGENRIRVCQRSDECVDPMENVTSVEHQRLASQPILERSDRDDDVPSGRFSQALERKMNVQCCNDREILSDVQPSHVG